MRILMLGLLSLLWILPSCKKTISTDEPLPKVRKQALYISTNNYNFISFDPATGAKNWEVPLKGVNEGVPVVIKQTIYLLAKNGFLYGIDAISGKIRLEKDMSLGTVLNVSVQPSLAVFGNSIMIANARLLKVDTLGNVMWSYDPGNECSTSPTISNGKVYVGVKDGSIHAVDASSGTQAWTTTPIAFLDPNDIISSSPRVSGGLVYFGADNKQVYAVNESNGNPKWSYTTGDKVQSSPLVYGGMCVIGSQDFMVHCIDTTIGTKRWTYETSERVFSSPTIHELTNTVLVGSYDFNLYAIDHVTGKLKWKYPAGSLIKSSPLVLDNFVYFTAFDRYLYCVDIRNGSLVWKSFLNGGSESSPFIDAVFNDQGQDIGLSPSISGMSKY